MIYFSQQLAFQYLWFAASSITFNTSLGCESITTWLDGNSVVFAFILFAIKRSKSGCIALSFFATTNQVGLFFQAGSPPLSSNTVCEAGICVAQTKACCLEFKSFANAFLTPSSDRKT